MTSVLDAFPILRWWWDDFAVTARLDVCKVLKGSFSTNWFVAKVVVFGGADCEDEGWEINKETPRLPSPINPHPR